jgi:hypothetical protein
MQLGLIDTAQKTNRTLVMPPFTDYSAQESKGRYPYFWWFFYSEHEAYFRFTKRFGASIYEATMRPNPRYPYFWWFGEIFDLPHLQQSVKAIDLGEFVVSLMDSLVHSTCTM